MDEHEVRVFALQSALKIYPDGSTTGDVISTAKDIEYYIKGRSPRLSEATIKCDCVSDNSTCSCKE